MTMTRPFVVTPIFYDNYTCEKPIVVNQGGTSCFCGQQKVVTRLGSKPINKLKVGDTVKCFNEKTKKQEWKKVLNTFEYKNTKRTIKVKLKNGQTIIATEDHEFYYEGGWYSLKHLLSLLDGKMDNNTEI